MDGDISSLEDKAAYVASRLGEVANQRRLLILCHLARLEMDGDGEASVGELQRLIGISQSALSQHLARLRNAGMVATRRDGQVIHYRLADREVRLLMQARYDAFCAEVVQPG